MEIIRFPIDMKPLPFLHMTQNQKSVLRTPEECPYKCGLPRRTGKADMVDYFDKKTGRIKQRRAGCPHALSAEGLALKRRIHKYNEYKLMLRAMALEMHFTLPHAGAAIYFFMPMPAYMLRIKKRRLAMNGAPNLLRPDVSNLLKSVEDALDAQDQHIYHYAGLGKYWTDGPGYIEIHTGLPVYEPYRDGVWSFQKQEPLPGEEIIIKPPKSSRSVYVPSGDAEYEKQRAEAMSCLIMPESAIELAAPYIRQADKAFTKLQDAMFDTGSDKQVGLASLEQTVKMRKVDIGGGRALHTSAPLDESKIQYAPITPDSFDGGRLSDLTIDGLPKWDSFEAVKAREELQFGFNKQAIKNGFRPPVDVNDKEAMRDVLEGAANRRRKRK